MLEVTANISTYLDCFELEKFEPVDSEEELSKRGLELLETNQLWGGLVRTTCHLFLSYLIFVVAENSQLAMRLVVCRSSKPHLRCLLDWLLVSRSCQSLSPTRFGLTPTRCEIVHKLEERITHLLPGGQHEEIRGPTESSRTSKKARN